MRKLNELRGERNIGILIMSKELVYFAERNASNMLKRGEAEDNSFQIPFDHVEVAAKMEACNIDCIENEFFRILDSIPELRRKIRSKSKAFVGIGVAGNKDCLAANMLFSETDPRNKKAKIISSSSCECSHSKTKLESNVLNEYHGAERHHHANKAPPNTKDNIGIRRRENRRRKSIYEAAAPKQEKEKKAEKENEAPQRNHPPQPMPFRVRGGFHKEVPGRHKEKAKKDPTDRGKKHRKTGNTGSPKAKAHATFKKLLKEFREKGAILSPR